MKLNHYFDQNRMEKKDGKYKINEHKGKGNDGKQGRNQQIQRSNIIPGKNNNFATVNNIKQLPTEKKKKMFVVGDSMIKNITGTNISRNHAVKIRPHPEATSSDICDYIKPELRH